ncbi:MAG: helicase-exonuclease AddAB subunit AddA [Andreesenia angusta]|nr:helicase-exonuclease AddAB subunit AddA [Andreesenia angusta]
MIMPKWTKEQSLAIDDRNNNLLVSAAAGSGKTAVLVERIIKLALNGEADIDKMLIVTFTRAAAAEMRERIMEAFNKEIAISDRDPVIAKKQISLINKSMIMTIHSFCTHILRKYFHKIDLDPNFRVLEMVEADILKQEALDEILEEEYKISENKEFKEGDFLNLIEMFTGDRDDREIEDIIMQVHNFIQSQPYPFEWLKESIEKYRMNEEELKNSAWYKVINKNIVADIEIAYDLISEAYNISNQSEGPYNYIDILEKEKTELKSILNQNEGIDQIINNINEFKFARLPSKKMECSIELKEKAMKLRNDAKDKIKSIIKSYPDIDFKNQAEELNYMYEPMKYLYLIIKRFEDRYRQKKTEKGALDFNDLEHRTLEILEDEDIRDEIRESFSYIFVDEYQDSNIVQETIVNHIKRENNLFLVGDVKQSIYRFRLADPTLFIEKYKRFKEDCQNSKRIDLNKNFRSRKEILDWVNYIFKNIMSEEVGEIEYDKDSYLYNGAEYSDSKYNRKTEINIIDSYSSEEDDEIDSYLNDMKKEEMEARFIANRIKKLKQEETYDSKTGEFRPIRNKDIVILLRTMKNKVDIYESILLESEIPVYADVDKGYFSSIEIKIFLNLLKIIDNIKQDIPLISTMKSFIGGFTLEELIDIRISYKDMHFHQAIYKYIEEKEDELSEKLSKFIEKIDSWKEMSRLYKLDEFIWRVMMQSNYYYYLGTLTNGKQRQANLEILVDKANELEMTSISGLFNFIRFSDRLKDIDSDFGTAKILGENEDVVRIMSVHKSKGLEFPIVICADMNKRFNLYDIRREFLFHKDLGIGIDYIDIENRIKVNTISKKAIKEKINIELLSEEMRVLYVAMTRAKDKLILFGTKNLKGSEEIELAESSNNISFHNIIKARTFLDWILLCIENDNSYRDYELIIRRREDLKEEEKKKETRKEELKKLLKKAKDEELRETKIIDSLEWQYPFIEDTKAQSRFGVTSYIKLLDHGEDINNRVEEINELPNFMKETEEISGAEIGTAIHDIIANMDFRLDHDCDDIVIKIDELLKKEILSKSIANKIDIKPIENFFKSDIYKRIKNSDRIRKEEAFIYKIEDIGSDIYIQGIIDCVFEEDGEMVLLDYKTDRNSNKNYYIDNYKEQIELYTEALEGILKKTVKEKYIYSLYLNELIEIV